MPIINKFSKTKKLNEFNRRILDSAPVSVVALNKEGAIITANRLAMELMDKPQRPIINSKLTDTYEIKNNQKLRKLYKNLLEKGKPFYYESLLYKKSSSLHTKHLNIIAVPLFDNNKKLDGAISIALDNTEAMHTKQRLQELNKNLEIKVLERTKQLDVINKKLREAIELKSKFIADASHELRTPLTVIQGNLDLAIREIKNTQTKIPETYTLILNEIKRMTGVLSDLTILTNFDAKTETLHYEEVNLKKLIRAASQSLQILAEQKKIRLIYKKNAKRVKIFGDEAKLEKLLLNIIRNAIKYTEKKGKIKIWIENNSKFVKINIQDNGIGIPKEDLPYIFGRFYRVDKARSRKEGGTGLGLSICRWIAEAHGGYISVESKQEKGSTFTIHLPCQKKAVKGLDLRYKD
ncbi:PAS domain-containing protein [Candidatus Parcubacteria bacterium]|nr:PAS domain-containing protein [Candidatus Parcubacteria bacterium]